MQSDCEYSEPFLVLEDLPNEIKEKIFQSMDLETSLNAQKCFRNFDAVARIDSKKNAVNIFVLHVTNDHIEILLNDPQIDKRIMKSLVGRWIVMPGESTSGSKMIQKNCHSGMVSETLFPEMSPLITTNKLVAELIQNPLLDVKLLKVDFGFEDYCLFNTQLQGWSEALVFMNNYPIYKKYLYRCTGYQVGHSRFHTNLFGKPQNIGHVARRRRKYIEKYISYAVTSYLFFDEMLNYVRTFEEAKCIFRRFIIKFTGLKHFQRYDSVICWENVVNDLMCIRAAYHKYPEQYFETIGENFKETISKLRDGFENPELRVEAVAIISVMYLAKFHMAREDQQNKLNPSFEYLLKENLKLPNHEALLKKLELKVEWLHGRNSRSK